MEKFGSGINILFCTAVRIFYAGYTAGRKTKSGARRKGRERGKRVVVCCYLLCRS
jgi:hypothetical protein